MFFKFFAQNVLFWNEKFIFNTKFTLLKTKSLIAYLNLKNEFVLRTTLNPKTKTLATLNPKTIKSMITTLIFKTRNDNLRKTFIIQKYKNDNLHQKLNNLCQKLHNLRSKINYN